MKKNIKIIILYLLIILIFILSGCGKKQKEYELAVDYYNKARYGAALVEFEKIRGYKDADEYIKMAAYEVGVELFDKKDFFGACENFKIASGYKDSDEKIAYCNNSIKNSNLLGEWKIIKINSKLKNLRNNITVDHPYEDMYVCMEALYSYNDVLKLQISYSDDSGKELLDTVSDFGEFLKRKKSFEIYLDITSDNILNYRDFVFKYEKNRKVITLKRVYCCYNLGKPIEITCDLELSK